MNQDQIRELLQQYKAGEAELEQVVQALRSQPFEELGFAKVDLHRGLRTGMSEVIYGAGKTAEQITAIASRMREHGVEPILITRMDAEKAEAVLAHFKGETVRYEERSGTCIIGELPEPTGLGTIVVATGGTSDLFVAEEAALTAEAMGNKVKRIYDVGVAGIHRLFAHQEDILEATVIIAVAGMEGALASVIGGVADCPIIAVPTSVGYGANFGGLSALLSMLNSCASGVSVVNIDNGFGAGYQASMINHLHKK